MTVEDIDDIAEVIASSIKEATAPLLKRIETLEEGGIKYLGNYQRAAGYKRGDTVTHKGSLWTALQGVSPGDAPSNHPDKWQLSQKGR